MWDILTLHLRHIDGVYIVSMESQRQEPITGANTWRCVQICLFMPFSCSLCVKPPLPTNVSNIETMAMACRRSILFHSHFVHVYHAILVAGATMANQFGSVWAFWVMLHLLSILLFTPNLSLSLSIYLILCVFDNNGTTWSVLVSRKWVRFGVEETWLAIIQLKFIYVFRLYDYLLIYCHLSRRLCT